MRILIIGSEGFIGSHLVTWFLKKNWEVSGVDLVEYPRQKYEYTKLSRLSPEYDELLGEKPYDICINAAGNGNVSFSVEHPVKDFEANVLDTIKLLEAMRKFAPGCRYIHISSAAVYGNPRQLPIREEDSCLPVSPYGWHKLISEQICKEYYLIYKIPTIILRPFSVYGPGLRKQLIWDLYGKLKGSSEVILFGTGGESRDFIYIEDLVLAIHIIIEKAAFNASCYNIACGEEITIEKICFLFNSFLAAGRNIKFNQEIRKGDPANWRADINKLTELGFSPMVKLEDGLRQTFEWLQSET